MNIRLHQQARTTPAIRREIQSSSLSERALARLHNTTRSTIRKWKHRDSVEDASHRPHHLQTTLTPAQEHIVVYLRTAMDKKFNRLFLTIYGKHYYKLVYFARLIA